MDSISGSRGSRLRNFQPETLVIPQVIPFFPSQRPHYNRNCMVEFPIIVNSIIYCSISMSPYLLQTRCSERNQIERRCPLIDALREGVRASHCDLINFIPENDTSKTHIRDLLYDATAPQLVIMNYRFRAMVGKGTADVLVFPLRCHSQRSLPIVSMRCRIEPRLGK